MKTVAMPDNLPDMPIDPDWIQEGEPTARGAIVTQSADKRVSGGYWQCSEGRFEWTFGWDEFAHVFEGKGRHRRRRRRQLHPGAGRYGTLSRGTQDPLARYGAGKEIFRHPHGRSIGVVARTVLSSALRQRVSLVRADRNVRPTITKAAPTGYLEEYQTKGIPVVSDVIRTGIIRCDMHGMWFGAQMDAHDPLRLREPMPVEDDMSYTWQRGGTHYFYYTKYSAPTRMTAPSSRRLPDREGLGRTASQRGDVLERLLRKAGSLRQLTSR